jgi:hypothetical protein
MLLSSDRWREATENELTGVSCARNPPAEWSEEQEAGLRGSSENAAKKNRSARDGFRKSVRNLAEFGDSFHLAYLGRVLKGPNMMSTSPAHGIVPPEPHSTGADFRKTWNYLPRWLRVILLLAFIVAGILVAIFRGSIEL